MNRATTFIMGAFSGLAAVAGWRYYHTRTATQVRYESRRLLDGIEIRQYPAVVVAETVAETESEARGKLRSYLSGANAARTAISETTPVRIQPEPVALSTPTDEGSSSGRTRLGVYLPPSHTPKTAPEPRDRSVLLTVEPPRTVAVCPVSRYPHADRIKRAKTQLQSALVKNDFIAVGSAFVFRYENTLLGSLTERAEVGVEIA